MDSQNDSKTGEGVHPLKVAVLAGGSSGEREVSLRSGAGVKDALQARGFEVEQLDVSDRGDLNRLVSNRFDAAFLALHGGLGEDGSVQGMLQVLGIPYTGSGVWSSATAMDKGWSKVFYREHALVPPGGIEVSDAEQSTIDRVMNEVGFPCMIKPIDGGSSLGLHRADSLDELLEGLEEAFTWGARILVERYVEGEVYTVGVIGNDDLTSLPAVWLDFEGECDYEAKYGDTGRLRHICPPPLLDDEAHGEVQELAKAAHRALNCRGVSRSDFIRDSTGAFWLLETNTLPGMTPTSSLPTAAAVAGIAYEELCARLVGLAISNP